MQRFVRIERVRQYTPKTFLTKKIISFLHKHKDQPFFLYHPSQLPHGPIAIPEIHPAVKHNSKLTEYEKEYASMILKLDETVGIVLDELERLGIDDRTMIVFCFG